MPVKSSTILLLHSFGLSKNVVSLALNVSITKINSVLKDPVTKIKPKEIANLLSTHYDLDQKRTIRMMWRIRLPLATIGSAFNFPKHNQAYQIYKQINKAQSKFSPKEIKNIFINL